jgi:hypothetical protein
LRFPDRRTDWVVLLAASLVTPVDGDELLGRLEGLHRAVPLVGATLNGETWLPGEPGSPVVVDDEPVGDPRLDAPFDLASEAPLRVVIGMDGRRLALACHHAAFDGLALVAVMTALLGGSLPAPVTSAPPGPPGPRSALLRRLLNPSDRIARSAHPPRRDSYVTEEVEMHGPSITARLAQACVDAAAEHNRVRGARWRRIGISIAKGGPPGVGNVASYRRVDLPAGEPVAPLIAAALASRDEPTEQTRAGLALALARPVVHRFSDSFLISNLGRQSVPNTARLDFFPVARGRSAVAFGVVGVAGMSSTVSLRARDLSKADAQSLLAGTVRSFRADT